MDLAKTKYFRETAEMFRVAEVDGKPAGFLIAVREGTDYDSENYVWFSEQYPQFLYIDRIVIDEPYRGMGIGRMFYEDAGKHARQTGVKVVTVSQVGRFSLPCAARKFDFFIIGAAVIGFFWISSCCVR